jgi:multiple sugar transport system substrate-binding protein
MVFLKRRFRLLLVFVLTFSSFSLIRAEDAIIKPASCTKPGSLTMWVWDENWAKIINKSIDVWKEKYCPGADVKLEVYPWSQYWDTLKTRAANQDLPDVFNMSQDRFYFYASNNALLDLQPYWDAAKVDSKVWGTGMVNPYRWGDNDDLYAGPVNWDTVVIYYNKDLFDAAKLEYPTPEWTWDDFAKDAEALTDKSKDIYGAAVYSEYQSGYPNWIASTGIPPIVGAGRTQCTLSERQSMGALKFLKGLYDKGFMPSVSVMGGAGADDSFNYFKSGKVAMVTNGSWKLPDALKDLTFNWDVVQLPKNPDTGRSRSILHSVGYVASSYSKNPDLAANLILYLVSDEGAKFFAEAGGVAPANPNQALQDIWINSFDNSKRVNIQAFVDATKDSQGVTVFDEIWDQINTEIVVNIFDKNMSVEEATKKTCDFVTTQLPAVKK